MLSGGTPPSVLRRLEHIYEGPLREGGPSDPLPSTSLRSLGQQLGEQLLSPPSCAVVLVVGGKNTGKSSCVNVLAQELVLEAGSGGTLPVRWVQSSVVPRGVVPKLLNDVSEQFPEWLSREDIVVCCSGRSASPRLDAVELVEALFPGEQESAGPINVLGSRADVVVCLLDSQHDAQVSDRLLEWLRALPCMEAESGSQRLQFVLSKADLLRDSERVKMIGKLSRLLNEKLGRGYEILPVALGDLTMLLNGIDDTSNVFTYEGQEFTLQEMPPLKPVSRSGLHQLEAGPSRVIALAQECASARVQKGLDMLAKDCQTLSAVVDARMTEVQTRGRAAAMSSRNQFFQFGGALALVSAILPYVLDDVEPEMVTTCMWVTAALAFIVMVLAFCIPASKAPDASLKQEEALLADKQYFLTLLQRQHSRWTGFDQTHRVERKEQRES